MKKESNNWSVSNKKYNQSKIKNNWKKKKESNNKKL